MDAASNHLNSFKPVVFLRDMGYQYSPDVTPQNVASHWGYMYSVCKEKLHRKMI